MFKISNSALIEVVIDGGKPRPKSRYFGADLLQINSHQRRSRSSVCVWVAEAVLQLQEKQLAPATDAEANVTNPAGGAWGRQVLTEGRRTRA